MTPVSIAFYAPMKSPQHPVPSGDRSMAQGIVAALEDMSPPCRVDLASELRSWEGKGNSQMQRTLMAEARREIEVVLARPEANEWRIWITYHNYYKAPDLIGPTVSGHLGIPYVIVEASRSHRRLKGSWEIFARQAESACDAASNIFYLTARDRPALEEGRPAGQNLHWLKPFLNQSELPAIAERRNGDPTLLAVGMLRHGDKFASYQRIASALRFLRNDRWVLKVIGDGTAAIDVKALFHEHIDRVEFLGLLNPAQVASQMAQASVFVWPGVNEAFGMVYLEAQAAGLPVVAEDRPGVRDVIGPTGTLVNPGDARAFATAVDNILDAVDQQNLARQAARDYIKHRHLRPAATAVIAKALSPLIGGAE